LWDTAAESLVSTVQRLLDLWRLHAWLDVLFITRSTSTAVAWYIADIIIGLAAVTTTFFLAERFNGIGPWSRGQVVFLLGYALVVRGCLNVFFNYNVAHISRRIGRGQLDHLMIQPQPLWMALLTEGFAPVTGGAMLPGVGLIAYATGQLGLDISPAWLVLLLGNLVASMAIVLAFNFAWATLAFWAPRSAEEINHSTWNLMMTLQGFPLEGLPSLVLGGLLTIVPVGLIAWLPSRALLGIDMPAWGSMLVPAAGLLCVGLAAAIFMRGLRQYGRTGSTRYLSWGHRR
jgi:ABC-2 type transport system permease protein